MFLIVSKAGDIDAHAIAWALNRIGCEALALSFGDLRPNISQLSASEADQVVKLRWGDKLLDVGKLQASWLRKPPSPLLSSKASPDDSLFERGNYDETLNMHLNGVVHSFSKFAPMINQPSHSIIANNKLYQLLGLDTPALQRPRTYIGSAKSEILEFFSGRETIVYKPLRHSVWLVNDGASVCGTSEISLDEISEISDDELMPGVFQEFILKDAEFRVIVFGDQLLSIEQKPLDEGKHSVDWRFVDKARFCCKIVNLPAHIREACISLVKSLSLDHASIDLAVDQDGVFYFLEANPFGQFLAYEGELPDSKLLERSVKLVLSKAGQDQNKYNFDRVSVENFVSDFDEKTIHASIDNGDHVHDVISRKAISLSDSFDQSI